MFINDLHVVLAGAVSIVNTFLSFQNKFWKTIFTAVVGFDTPT